MPAPRQNRPRNGPWVIAHAGNVLYRADSLVERSAASARFPAPLIAPRRTRPHSIHIVTFPPGYVPRELRPRPTPKPKARLYRCPAADDDRVGSASGPSRRSHLQPPALGKLLASLSSAGRSVESAAPAAAVRPTPSQAETSPPNLRQAIDDDDTSWRQPTQTRSRHRRLRSRPPPHVHRLVVPPLPLTASDPSASAMSVRSVKSTISSHVTEVLKPVASGSGVTCSLLLAEPNIFLSGFDHDDHLHRHGLAGTALLRGKLQINVSKKIKVKAIQLKLIGRARTEWPEGIPPLKQDVVEEESLRTQVLTFFNATNDGWETEYGNQCIYQLKTDSSAPSSINLAALPRVGNLIPAVTPSRALTAKELKRLSLQSDQSRSFGKGDNGVATATQAKGFKIFYPGIYDYAFELPIDHHQLETTKLQYGSVRWELHTTVERAGAFKPKLHGVKEVSIMRLPDQMSLETTEPISISRQWEDQLHYDIVISGKSFPIGSKIPIAFKLTPLAKVHVHKLKVYVTESIEYWTNDRRVTRRDPGRKILLLEKAAGKELDPAWASSDMATLRGGELTLDERREAREVAQLRRTVEAARARRAPEPLPEPTANLLGDLDLGLESMWDSTEIEANVQIPTCEMMAKNKDLRLHPDCSWKNVNVYHWIKIVMRISRLDPDDPTGIKRRHFEISIDSPFTVLNCRATQANTNLPAYSGLTSQPALYQSACGCPDAAAVITSVSPSSSTGTLLGPEMGSDALTTPPQMTHLPASESQPRTSLDSRPVHLLRAPSFNPPAFDEDVAPPPAIVITPPPHYDAVIGSPSVDGLADYFARLADYGYHEQDSGSDSDEQPPRILDRSGRVNVSHPRTPGGRMPSRSMEISRPLPELTRS